MGWLESGAVNVGRGEGALVFEVLAVVRQDAGIDVAPEVVDRATGGSGAARSERGSA